jgi:gas vesicle protein
MTKERLYNEQNSNADSGFRNGLLFLLIGGGIGATLALLFAPKSGVELRSDIVDMSRRGYDEALERTQQLRDQTADIYQAVKEKADGIFNYASTKLSSNSGDLVATAQDMVDDVSKTASAALDEANASLKSGEQHRRPTNIM